MKTICNAYHDLKYFHSKAERMVSALCFGLACGFSTVVMAQTDATDGNLVPNGSFELEGAARSGKLQPEGWAGFFSETKSYSGVYVDDKSQVHSGERAVSIVGDETAAPATYAMWLSGWIEVNPETAYSIEGWIKTSECSGKGAWLWIAACEDENGTQVLYPLYSVPVLFFTATQDWEQWSWEIRTKNVHRLRIACRLDGPGAAWFDDVNISER